MSSDAQKVGLSGSIELRELQSVIRSEGVCDRTVSPEQLAGLARKLQKVRSWGGAYAGIEFCPEIEALLRVGGTIGGGIVELAAAKEGFAVGPELGAVGGKV